MGKNLHGQNGGTAANVENDLVLEKVLVLDDRVHVGSRANLIFLQRQSQSHDSEKVPMEIFSGKFELYLPTSPHGFLKIEPHVSTKINDPSLGSEMS